MTPTTPKKRPAAKRAAPKTGATVKPRKPEIESAVKAEPKKKARPSYIFAVGRRKRAVARTRLIQNGSGIITVNEKEFNLYFPTPEQQTMLTEPLAATGTRSSLDFSIKVQGGGTMGQAEACRHGISRALVKMEPDWRKTLKPMGFLRRDPREKERKKPGLKRARRGPQWAKR